MKKIIIAIASIAFVFSFASCSQKPAKKEMGIQLYSLRTLIGSDEDFAANKTEVLKALADMGYTCVEAANYDGEGHIYGEEPEQLKADLDAAGLKMISTHVNHWLDDENLASKDFSNRMDWWKTCIAAHKKLGVKYIVMPSMPGDLPTLADVKTYCEYYNAIGKLCADQGMKFGFHNHSGEFEKIEGKVFYDYMIENTDPRYVFFQMDVYWADNAGVSPVEYFKRYPGRFECIHVKDWREVGQSGKVGFDAIFNNAALAGVKDYVVEIEETSPEVGDILESCRISADYLLSAPFVKESYSE